MMESVAFNETNLVEDEDYVLVNTDESSSIMEIDDEELSYEDDDDYVIFSLPAVGDRGSTNGSSKQSSLSTSVISLEGCEDKFGDEIDDLLMKLEKTPGNHLMNLDESKIDSKSQIETEASSHPNEIKTKERIQQTDQTGKAHTAEITTKQESNVCGSRLSNKKRRKRLKMMKKATAAAEAAASLQVMRQKNPLSSSPSKSVRKGKLFKSKKLHNNANIAVICATESLSEYREKHNI